MTPDRVHIASAIKSTALPFCRHCPIPLPTFTTRAEPPVLHWLALKASGESRSGIGCCPICYAPLRRIGTPYGIVDNTYMDTPPRIDVFLDNPRGFLRDALAMGNRSSILVVGGAALAGEIVMRWPNALPTLVIRSGSKAKADEFAAALLGLGFGVRSELLAEVAV